jgi:hypothetical protein
MKRELLKDGDKLGTGIKYEEEKLKMEKGKGEREGVGSKRVLLFLVFIIAIRKRKGIDGIAGQMGRVCKWKARISA